MLINMYCTISNIAILFNLLFYLQYFLAFKIFYNIVNKEHILIQIDILHIILFLLELCDKIVNKKNLLKIIDLSFFNFRRDRLLVAHGKLDDNVHFQHTERLRAALDRHHKPFRLQVKNKSTLLFPIQLMCQGEYFFFRMEKKTFFF